MNKDSLVQQKEYPTESSSKSRESVYMETSVRRSRGILEQWSVDNGYNQLVDHVGVHGQRRLTEALNKDLLVRQKEYPTESSSKSRESVYMETSARRSRGFLEQWSVDNDRDGLVSSGR
ncbi:hypothetical protein Taro_015348 [Colocasia esculenta]|uniref:Uncharacterized protein n=1 Tax=Colocasia esculenta TaxID=4460 RepID=A0A843UKL0_COLES|nr:hypothetical protein [Colocasia esculenta]